MGDSMNDPQSWRARADECRERARDARDPETRAAWLQMAEDWLQLAGPLDGAPLVATA